MPLEAVLAEFAAAATQPHRPPPSFAPDRRRFAVYRNNIAAALIGALEARYPVTRRLVGEAFFRGLAGAYVARHKPPSPVLIAYGADFSAFVGDFTPARDLPYLADVARLENAWVEAYHAAEAEPLTVTALADLEPERLAEATFAFHPATRLVDGAYAAASIWAAHQNEADPPPVDPARPEAILVVRPGAQVELRVLPPDGWAFARALQAGATFAAAAAATPDPGAQLVGLVEVGALSGLRLAPSAQIGVRP